MTGLTAGTTGWTCIVSDHAEEMTCLRWHDKSRAVPGLPTHTHGSHDTKDQCLNIKQKQSSLYLGMELLQKCSSSFRLLGENNTIRLNCRGSNNNLTFYCKVQPGLLMMGNLFRSTWVQPLQIYTLLSKAAATVLWNQRKNSYLFFFIIILFYTETNLQENSLHSLSDGIYHSIQILKLAALLAVTLARQL